jgi:ATP-binding cassette subfamily A (ABC1) protein 5
MYNCFPVGRVVICAAEVTNWLMEMLLCIYVALFGSLEKISASGRTVASDLGIQSYGVSMTTLEEVFLHLEELEEQESEESMEIVENMQGSGFHDSQTLLYGASSTRHEAIQVTSEVGMEEDKADLSVLVFGGSSVIADGKLYWQQFLAMLSIRYLIAFRVPASVVFRLIIPPILVVVGVLVSRNISPKPSQPGPLLMTPDLYLSNANSSAQPPYCKTPPNMKPSLLLSTYDSNVSESYPFLIENFRDQNVGYCQPSVSVSENNTVFNEFLLNYWPHSAALELEQLIMTNKSIVVDFTAWYNDTDVHSLPVAINVMNSVLYANLTGNTTGIKVTNHPFRIENPKLQFDAGSYVAVLLIGIALTISPGGFPIILVTERELRISHQLRVAGLSRLVYWLASLVSDVSLYLTTVVLIIILIPALDLKPFEPQPALGLTVLILFISMPLQTLYAYVWSFAFSKSETCQSVLPTIITLMGLIPYVVVAVLYPFAETASIILNYIFMVLSPPYATIGCLWFTSTVYQQHFANPFKHDLSASTYFSFSSHVVPGILMMVVEMVLLSLFLTFLDKRSVGDKATCANCCQCGIPVRADVESPDDELGDDDVQHEKQVVLEKVATLDNQTNVPSDTFVLMEGLKKEFMDSSCCKKQADIKVKLAVKDLNLSVKAGEIFGLLGPNGAGKTTAMNVFTGDMTPTEGRVFLANEEITYGVAKTSLALGYCPQVDALWPEITLKEHLRTFAWIKGVPRESTNQMITRFTKIMKITEHIDKRSKELSGGTKRKLSFLMSMVGGPKVLLLDEPSTGMDPKAKRALWNIISDCITDQRSAILTTHSMEEADALCSRIGILVSGSLRCVGSTQHLKSKYGAGYHLEMKLSSATETLITRSSHSEEQSFSTAKAIMRQTSALKEADCDHASDGLTSLVSHIKKTFPGTQLIECFGDRATFVIPAESVQSLSSVFACLEKTKVEFGVEEYSLSQSSLEQVFISFAKEQRQDD